MPSPRRQPHFRVVLASLALVWGALVVWGTASSSADPVTPAGNAVYFPFAAKPVATPTFTPTPTPVPLPPDVRVDWSCCRVKGPSQDPTDEYVCFRSHDSRSIDMTGWQVLDEANHTYTFPPFVLPSQATVTLHSGAGRNTNTDLYWGNGAIWNNTHDTIYLYDASHSLIDSWIY